MEIRKAIITAAGRGARLYPAATTVDKGMQPLVDQDGLTKPTLQIIAEEALHSGIEQVAVVCAPGDESAYRERFDALRKNLLEAYPNVAWAQDEAARIDDLMGRLTFCVQDEPRGYGHAVLAARDFAGDDGFLLLLGDHLYLSHRKGERCAAQLLAAAKREHCSFAGVQATPEHQVGLYGTVRGKRIAGGEGFYAIEHVVEKPSVSLAELELHTPGLRAGHYLCFFGMHVFAPGFYAILEDVVAEDLAGEASETKDRQLTTAIRRSADRGPHMALEIQGRRYDTGAPFGILNTQLALALAGPERDSVLGNLVTLMSDTLRNSGEG